MSKNVFITSLLAISLLTGCLIPESFNSEVTFKNDGAYTFQYSGTAVHGLAAMQIKKAGSLSSKEEKELQKFGSEILAKSPEFKKIEYQNNGRYTLNIDVDKKAGAPLKVLDTFNVYTDKNGLVSVYSSKMSDKTKAELSQLGISIKGTLIVKVPKNAEIISQNATNSSSFFGYYRSYTWKITNLNDQPILQFRLKK